MNFVNLCLAPQYALGVRKAATVYFYYHVLGVEKTAAIYFDSTTGKATGGIECGSTDEVMDILAVRYFYNSASCNYNCRPTKAGDYGIYLDGTNIICKNENYIRQACSGRHSCDLGDISELSLPDLSCGGGSNRASAMRISFRCLEKG